MAALTVAELVEALRRTQVLDAARLAEAEREARGNGHEPDALIERWARQGWLTELQAEFLREGRGDELLRGPYLLMDRLGRGGMGEVYKARQERLDRIVALKIIRQEHLAHADTVARFRREAKAAAKLQHPNVVTIYDADEADGVFFIAMECVEGTDLSRLVHQGGPLPVAQACEYIRQVAMGLQHAYEHGLVHRDIKPSNLIVTRTSAADENLELVKILDFGLARWALEPAEDGVLTPTDQWLGTPDFIAPEQARNSKEVDIRADIFSLGCALYFLLTGRSAFTGSNKMEKLLARFEDDLTPASSIRPQVSAPLDRVLSRMLERRPSERYQIPLEVARALEPFCDSTEVLRLKPGASPASVGDTSTVSRGKGVEAQTARARRDSGPTPIILEQTPPLDSTTPRMASPAPLERRPRAIAFLAVGVLLAGAAVAPFALMRRDPSPAASFVNSIGMKLVRIPAGEFMMGAPDNEAEHGDDEVPQHRVEIKKPFYMGAYEVTQAEFQAVMGFNPSHFSPLGDGAKHLEDVADTGKYPADSVTWNDAVDFCKQLSALEKREKRTYRLPTEAEWEYACRAGTATPFWFGRQLSADQANFDGRRPYGDAQAGGARMATTPVGSFRSNAFGLYDVHGNVWEWCQERHVPYVDKLQPGGPNAFNAGRVLRGGGCLFSGADCRSAKRHQSEENRHNPYYGFRVVCEP